MIILCDGPVPKHGVIVDAHAQTKRAASVWFSSRGGHEWTGSTPKQEGYEVIHEWDCIVEKWGYTYIVEENLNGLI